MVRGPEGPGGGSTNRDAEVIGREINNRSDHALRNFRKYLYTDLDAVRTEEEISRYLKSPVDILPQLSDATLYEVLVIATSTLYEEAVESGIESLLDRFIDVSYVTLEDEYLAQVGFDPILITPELIRYRAMALSVAAHTPKNEITENLRTGFRFAIARMFPEVPPKLLISLKASHREFLEQAYKNAPELSFERRSRILSAGQKSHESEHERRKKKIDSLHAHGVDSRIAQRFVDNEPKKGLPLVDFEEVLKAYPNPDDLQADILGTEFVNITNDYYKQVGENG